MNWGHYLLFFSAIVAASSVVIGASFSKHRPWSVPKSYLFSLLLTGAISAAIELYTAFCPITESHPTWTTLKLLFSVSIGSAFAFFIASVSLFIVVCIEALRRFHYR